MRKIHTREKRKMTSPTHLGSARPENRDRKKRPKTFTSEESAKKWAEAKGITKFELKDLRLSPKDKKIRVIAL